MGVPLGDGERGFIVVQIDGLSHAHLLDSVAKGYAPYMSELMRSGDADLYRWCSGLPSTTPAVQAKLMYGNGYDIPGFRWYEKEERRALVCKFPRTLAAIQERVSDGRRGLLYEGSSYSNMFDGGAASSLFTLSAIGRSGLFGRAGAIALFIILLLSPVRVSRIIFLSLWTYLSVIWRKMAAVFWPSKFERLSLLSPFFYVLTGVIVREVETFAVLVDIYRGIPSIFVNFTSYDEWAHLFGPSDAQVYRALRAIDGQIRQIDRMRRRGSGRPYDLFILSDHGMAPSAAFETVFGLSVGQFVANRVNRPVTADETQAGVYDQRDSLSLLSDELAVAEELLDGLSANAAGSLRRSLEKRGEKEPVELPRQAEIVVRNSGPLSHVYFHDVEAPLTLSEIENLYPGIVDILAVHPGIEVVAVRTDEGPFLITNNKRVPCLPGMGEAVFAGLEDSCSIVASVRELMSFPHTGDLVLFGRWGLWGIKDLVVTFEFQRGTHGGVGGEQPYPFLLAVMEEGRDLSRLLHPEDIYHFLISYYTKTTSRSEAPTQSPEVPAAQPPRKI